MWFKTLADQALEEPKRGYLGPYWASLHQEKNCQMHFFMGVILSLLLWKTRTNRNNPELPLQVHLHQSSKHFIRSAPPPAYMQKAGDCGDISPQIFLDFPQNFRLRTRNQYCTQAIAWGSTILDGGSTILDGGSTILDGSSTIFCRFSRFTHF